MCVLNTVTEDDVINDFYEDLNNMIKSDYYSVSKKMKIF